MSPQVFDMEQIRDIFDVDAENGRLFWRKPMKHHPRLAGMEAGGAHPTHSGKSYWIVKIGKTAYNRSRLIFLAVHGHWPTPCVDHINGDSLDDRISNLREATVMQNAWNHKKRRKSASLPMGVRRLASSGRYQARIGFEGKQLHLGAFATPEEASAAYQAKRQELFREWA